MKKLLLLLIAAAFCSSVTFGLIACKPDEPGGGTPTEPTVEENFEYWHAGIKDAVTCKDDYTYSYTANQYFTDKDGTAEFLAQEKESRSGNKYYRYYNEYEVGEDSKLVDKQKELVAIKVVDDNGKTRTKRYEYAERFEPDADDARKLGYYVAPDNAAEKAEYSPYEVIGAFKFEIAKNFDEVCSAFKALWLDGAEESGCKFTFLLKRQDGAVTFSAKVEINVEEADDDGVTCSISQTSDCSFTVKDGKLSGYHVAFNDVYAYPDGNGNRSERGEDSVVFTYGDFDNALYESIDVTTEVTYHEYVGSVKFYINGYEYNSGMPVPVGDSVVADDINSYFSDWSTHSGSISLLVREDIDDSLYGDLTDEEKAKLIKTAKEANAKFISSMQIFSDAEMTKPFDGITINEADEEVALYIKLTPPSDDAYVLCVVRFLDKDGNVKQFIRYIHGCTHMEDGTLYFNSNMRLGYKVLSVDGKEPNENADYYFEGGSVHVFVCENT